MTCAKDIFPQRSTMFPDPVSKTTPNSCRVCALEMNVAIDNGNAHDADKFDGTCGGVPIDTEP